MSPGAGRRAWTPTTSAAALGTVYDPDADGVVQAELVADAAAAAARVAELREAARIAARADELQALCELGTLEQTEPRDGDEAAREELTRRAGGYVQGDVEAWFAHALAARLGHYRDPAAREAAAGLLPPPVLAHAALLTELSPFGFPDVDTDQLAFAARLANTAPEATGALVVFLARARSVARRPHTPLRRAPAPHAPLSPPRGPSAWGTDL